MNQEDNLERRTHAGRKNAHGGSTIRAWWMIKSKDTRAYVPLGDVTFPLNMLGKKVKFRVEVID